MASDMIVFLSLRMANPDESLMSALGHKRKSGTGAAMSAVRGIADADLELWNVR